MHTPIHAVIFDHDGTLVDSEPVHLSCWREVLKPHRATLSQEDYQRNLTGMPSSYSAAWLVDKFNLDTAPDALLSEKQKLLRELLTNEPFPLMPEVEPLLKYLRGLGLPLAVATGASRDEVASSLDKHGLKNYFATVISKEDVANNKPAPDVYQLAAQKLGIATDRCVAVEDSDNGEQAARAAGMRCLRYQHRGASASDDRFTCYTSLQQWFAAQLR
ncbi:MAG: HAD family phosphatase [Cellvibrionaceae bacterium]|nr:HAD family phosphatase [Cellvibrionaceae bacterium]